MTGNWMSHRRTSCRHCKNRPGQQLQYHQPQGSQCLECQRAQPLLHRKVPCTGCWKHLIEYFSDINPLHWSLYSDTQQIDKHTSNIAVGLHHRNLLYRYHHSRQHQYNQPRANSSTHLETCPCYLNMIHFSNYSYLTCSNLMLDS